MLNYISSVCKVATDLLHCNINVVLVHLLRKFNIAARKPAIFYSFINIVLFAQCELSIHSEFECFFNSLNSVAFSSGEFIYSLYPKIENVR